MKRQTNDTLTSRVYSYGTVPERIAPVLGADLARGQLALANRLWNVLCAIERARVARYRAIMRDEVQERIDELRLVLSRARDEIKAMRQTARRRAPVPDDISHRITEAKEELRRLIDEHKATVDQRHDARRAELDALNERTKRRIKRARQAAAGLGLYWGTYNEIVQRADAGRKHGGEMHFRRFSGDGTLTAQIIGGATAGRCVGGDHSFFQVDGPVDGVKYRRARMRIGSTDARDPVWLDVPAVIHRPIPADALIKSVSITKRAGKHTVNVTVNVPKAAPRPPGVAIAIDIGWRLLPHGVRVAYWGDSAGAHGEVVVSRYELAEFDRIVSLRKICDRNRDAFLPSLAEWFRDRAFPLDWPDVSSIAQWRSGDRLARLIREWGDKRLPADQEIFEMACDWRRQYLHLSNWWRRLSERTPLRLREQYRVFAAAVARKYSTVFVEEFDLREVAKLPQPEEPAQATSASTYRQMVSPSVFRNALLNACNREGVTVQRLPAEYSTRVCHACGHAGKWDQAESVMHRCDKCEEVWDQDRNAAINLLRLGLANGHAMPTENQPVRPPSGGEPRDRSQSAPQIVDCAGVWG